MTCKRADTSLPRLVLVFHTPVSIQKPDHDYLTRVVPADVVVIKRHQRCASAPTFLGGPYRSLCESGSSRTKMAALGISAFRGRAALSKNNHPFGGWGNQGFYGCGEPDRNTDLRTADEFRQLWSRRTRES